MASTTFSQLFAEAGGSTAAFTRDSPVGTGIEGPVLSIQVRPHTEPLDGKPGTWDDGSPKQQVIITVQTSQRDPSVTDDDGSRSVYVKWWGAQRQALVQALREAKAEDIEVGGAFSAQFVGWGPQPDNKAINPTKLFRFTYRAPSAAAGLFKADIPPVTGGFTAPPPPLPPRLPDAAQQPWVAPTAANAGTMGQAAQPAPAGTAAPVPGPAVDFAAVADNIRKLSAMSVPVATISQMTGQDSATIAAVLAAPAA